MTRKTNGKNYFAYDRGNFFTRELIACQKVIPNVVDKPISVEECYKNKPLSWNTADG